MAQKSQTVSQPEDQANSGSRTSSAKDGTGAPDSPGQSANSNGSSGPISSSALPQTSDPTPTSPSNSESPQPQPQAMEKPSAAGSQPSPYGTRSRNRTGAARPNYAEDKDLDMDIFDAYPHRKDGDPKNLKASTKQQGASSTSAPSNPPQTTPRSGNSSLRKPLPDTSKQINGTKDQPQGRKSSPGATATSSSASAANGTTTTNGASKGKKRKAADTASTASGSQTPSAANGTPSSSALQKRLLTSGLGSGNATPSGAGYGAETNMLTFEKCKSRPKDGKMVADDGTVLEVNGKFVPCFRSLPQWFISF